MFGNNNTIKNDRNSSLISTNNKEITKERIIKNEGKKETNHKDVIKENYIYSYVWDDSLKLFGKLDTLPQNIQTMKYLIDVFNYENIYLYLDKELIDLENLLNNVFILDDNYNIKNIPVEESGNCLTFYISIDNNYLTLDFDKFLINCKLLETELTLSFSLAFIRFDKLDLNYSNLKYSLPDNLNCIFGYKYNYDSEDLNINIPVFTDKMNLISKNCIYKFGKFIFIDNRYNSYDIINILPTNYFKCEKCYYSINKTNIFPIYSPTINYEFTLDNAREGDSAVFNVDNSIKTYKDIIDYFQLTFYPFMITNYNSSIKVNGVDKTIGKLLIDNEKYINGIDITKELLLNYLSSTDKSIYFNSKDTDAVIYLYSKDFIYINYRKLEFIRNGKIVNIKTPIISSDDINKSYIKDDSIFIFIEEIDNDKYYFEYNIKTGRFILPENYYCPALTRFIWIPLFVTDDSDIILNNEENYDIEVIRKYFNGNPEYISPTFKGIIEKLNLNINSKVSDPSNYLTLNDISFFQFSKLNTLMLRCFTQNESLSYLLNNCLKENNKSFSIKELLNSTRNKLKYGENIPNLSFDIILIKSNNPWQVDVLFNMNNRILRSYGIDLADLMELGKAIAECNLCVILAWSYSNTSINNDKLLTFAFDTDNTLYRFKQDISVSEISNLVDESYKPNN